MIIPVREGITLRTLTESDAKEVFQVIDDNRLYLREWLPWVDGTDDPSVTQRVIEIWETAFAEGREIVLGIFEDGRYIGNIGLHSIKSANNSAMIGYWLSAPAQGRGIMTDAVRALASYGFDELRLNRIYIYCATQNKKSRAIPERLGFRQEGILQDGENLYGQYVDLAVYGMLARQWHA